MRIGNLATKSLVGPRETSGMAADWSRFVLLDRDNLDYRVRFSPKLGEVKAVPH